MHRILLGKYILLIVKWVFTLVKYIERYCLEIFSFILIHQFCIHSQIYNFASPEIYGISNIIVFTFSKMKTTVNEKEKSSEENDGKRVLRSQACSTKKKKCLKRMMWTNRLWKARSIPCVLPVDLDLWSSRVFLCVDISAHTNIFKANNRKWT